MAINRKFTKVYIEYIVLIYRINAEMFTIGQLCKKAILFQSFCALEILEPEIKAPPEVADSPRGKLDRFAAQSFLIVPCSSARSALEHVVSVIINVCN